MLGFAVFSALSLVLPGFIVTYFDMGNNTGLFVLISALGAIAGWWFSSYVSINNAAKSHTINILLQMRNSSEFMTRQDRVRRYLLGKYKSISNDIIKIEQQNMPKDKEISLRSDVLYLTNYFEFICAGYRCGDLDEKILIRTLRSVLVDWHDRFKHFIEEERTENGVRNPSYFGNLEKTVEHFRKKGVRD